MISVDNLAGYGECLKDLQAFVRDRTGNGDPARRVIDSVDILDNFIQVGIDKVRASLKQHEGALEATIGAINDTIHREQNG